MLDTGMGTAYIALLVLLCVGFALYETGYGVCATVLESFGKRLATFVVSLASFATVTAGMNSDLIQNLPTFVLNLALLSVLTHIVTSMTRSLRYSCGMAIAVGGVIYPLFAHMVGVDGILTNSGYYDAAGSGIVHFVGAVIALLMSVYFTKVRDWKSLSIQRPGLASLGFVCIWAAWLLFTLIMSAPLVGTDPQAWIRGFVVSSTAAAWGAVSAVAFTFFSLGKVRIKSCTVGGLAGLVIVSADPFTLSFFDAVAYGVFAGILSTICSYALFKLNLKDPCSVISIHGPAGAIGVLMVSLSNAGVDLSAQLHGLMILSVLAVVAAVLLCELGVIMQDLICEGKLNLQR